MKRLLPWALFCVLLWQASAHACQWPGPGGWQTLATGVHVWAPEPQEVNPANGGRVMPVTVIEDGGEAWVIDPGPSLRAGQQLQQWVACRWGAKVRAVFNTHAHAENVLANAAFAEAQQRGELHIHATAGTAQVMARRCQACLEDLHAHAGDEAMAGTNIVLPDRTLRPGDQFTLGRHTLVVGPSWAAHSADDVLLWHPAHRIAWVGGMAYQNRLPELAQGSLRGWLAALRELRAWAPSWVVGTSVSAATHGGDMAASLQQTESYLLDLQASVLQAMETGGQGALAERIRLPAYAGWVGYAGRQGFNAQRAWRELEPLWMDGSLPRQPHTSAGN